MFGNKVFFVASRVSKGGREEYRLTIYIPGKPTLPYNGPREFHYQAGPAWQVYREAIFVKRIQDRVSRLSLSKYHQPLQQPLGWPVLGYSLL